MDLSQHVLWGKNKLLWARAKETPYDKKCGCLLVPRVQKRIDEGLVFLISCVFFLLHCSYSDIKCMLWFPWHRLIPIHWSTWRFFLFIFCWEIIIEWKSRTNYTWKLIMFFFFYFAAIYSFPWPCCPSWELGDGAIG